jgi:GNAT superfamily N-acetyltransferase
MDRADEPRVRELYAAGHPTWPPRGKHDYYANPTLVATVGGVVQGYAQYTHNVTAHGLVIAGYDSGVAADARGLGLGTALMRARIEIARDLGAVVFTGCTSPANTAMLQIHDAVGLVYKQTIAGYFADDSPPSDGLFYSLEL